MIRLYRLVNGYLDYKHSLGFKIKIEGYTLLRFADYQKAKGYDGPLTSEIALEWLNQFNSASQWYRARLYETLRTFSRYACLVDSQSQLLPKGSGKCHGRTNPYIYSDKDAAAMMLALSQLYSPDGLRAKSLSTLFGLMYSTGMRPSECIHLTFDDYDSLNGTIFVRQTKFNRERLVPLSSTTAEALEAHARVMTKSSKTDQIFQRTGGTSFDVRAVEYGWQLARQVLLPDSEQWSSRPPRPYDCRHSFCTHTIEKWVANGCDINAMMPLLSTYVGHSKIADTYWYLTATESLLDVASDIFWASVGGDCLE
jgi:integrase/recombinase XerD